MANFPGINTLNCWKNLKWLFEWFADVTLKHKCIIILFVFCQYFIGLGSPVEGPGMLEALAYGCIVLQPEYKPPLKLEGKPNNRSVRARNCISYDWQNYRYSEKNIIFVQLSSQNPFIERRIGKPHVFTFDYNNVTQLLHAMRNTLHLKVSPSIIKYSASWLHY